MVFHNGIQILLISAELEGGGALLLLLLSQLEGIAIRRVCWYFCHACVCVCSLHNTSNFIMKCDKRTKTLKVQ